MVWKFARVSKRWTLPTCQAQSFAAESFASGVGEVVSRDVCSTARSGFSWFPFVDEDFATLIAKRKEWWRAGVGLSVSFHIGFSLGFINLYSRFREKLIIIIIIMIQGWNEILETSEKRAPNVWPSDDEKHGSVLIQDPGWRRTSCDQKTKQWPR